MAVFSNQLEIFAKNLYKNAKVALSKQKYFTYWLWNSKIFAKNIKCYHILWILFMKYGFFGIFWKSLA